MRRRKKLLILFALATLVAVAAFLWLSWPRPEVSLTTLSRLTPGMSEADVAAVLGPPDADLTEQAPNGMAAPANGVPLPVVPGSPVAVGKQVPAPAAGVRLLRYSGRRATVTVEFDADGRLVRCYPLLHEVSGLERIRLRLNWW
jgi:hypothetical protein